MFTFLLAHSSIPRADSPEPRAITTTGNTDGRVAPDEIEFTLGIETKDKNLPTAKKLNDDRLQKALAALHTQKIESNGIDR